jgi:hypothetical protein
MSGVRRSARNLKLTHYPLAEANRALQDLKADRTSGTGVVMVDT